MKNLRNKRIASLAGFLALVLLFLIPHEARANVITDVALILPGLLIGKIIMPMMGWLVYLSAMALNASLQYSVVEMAKHITEAGIDDTWRVVRDLANMGFIFVLIYTALQTMFGYGNYKQTIKNIVIAALLINFSLLITKAIIDASNVVALFFYNAITVGATDPNHGLSSAFMDKLGIASLYSSTSAMKGTQLTIIGLAGSVIYLITSFSFFAVAAMFVIRFIALIFVLILSPLMFIADALPGMKDKTKLWRDTLTGQALFGPIYFMMTWVTLKVAGGLFPTGAMQAAALAGQVSANGAIKADPTSIATFLNFGILIGLIIASIFITKNTATKGASLIGKAINYATGAAGGATFGMAARAGRGTFGRAGSAVANSERVKNMIERGGAAGMAGRLALAGGNKAAKSSFDARSVGGLGKTLGAGSVAKNASFEQDVKDRTKRATDLAKQLKPSEPVLNAAKAAEKKADEDLVAHLGTLGYKKPEALANAEKEMENANKDKGKGAQARKEKAKENLKKLREEDNLERRKFIYNDATGKKLYEVAEKAEKDREHMENRSENFTKKAGEPSLQIPEIPNKFIDRVNKVSPSTANFIREEKKREADIIEGINKKGLGGYAADQQRAAASTPRNPVMKPIAWLANKTATAINLRREERDARVEAIRKATKEKSKKDKAADIFQEMVDEATEDNKKPEDTGGSTPPPADNANPPKS